MGDVIRQRSLMSRSHWSDKTLSQWGAYMVKFTCFERKNRRGKTE